MLSVLRRWRARGIPISSGITKRQQPHPHYRRLLGTAPGGGAGNATSSNAFVLALGSVVLGLGGYYLGARSNTTPAPNSPSSKPVYGTPDDFARAIEELKSLFSEGVVTTERDQLEAHGFSPNSHHPGTLRQSFLATVTTSHFRVFL